MTHHASARSLNRVAIHGAPRSGTTWIGEIVNSHPCVIYKYQPLFSYKFKNYLTPSSTLSDIEQFFDELSTCTDAFLDQEERRATGKLPSFQKSDATHVVYKEVRHHHILWNLLRRDPAIRLIAIVRNPIDVLSSWFAAPREFRRDLGWLEREEWRYALRKNMNRPEDFFGFEKWKEAAQIFLNLSEQFADRVLLVRYEDFQSNAQVETDRLLRFLGLAPAFQTDQFLANSRTRTIEDPYSVFRQAGQPRNRRFDNAVLAEIRREIETDLDGTPLERFLSTNLAD